MKKNPFFTIILLICIEIALYKLLEYTNSLLPSSQNTYADSMLPLFIFTIPVIATLISVYIKNIEYKKEFRYFSVFLLITSFVIFVTLSYIGALGKAYQH